MDYRIDSILAWRDHSVPHYRLTEQRACPQRGLGARLHPSKCRPGPCRDRILTRVGEIYSLLDIHNNSLIIIQITEQPFRLMPIDLIENHSCPNFSRILLRNGKTMED